jgi:hypothetical protein
MAVTLIVCTIALVIWTPVDVVRMLDDTRFKTGTQIVWVIVILLGGAIGAIVTWRSGAHRGAQPLRGSARLWFPCHRRRPVEPCSAATLTHFPTERTADRWPNSRSIASSTGTRRVPPA